MPVNTRALLVGRINSKAQKNLCILAAEMNYNQTKSNNCLYSLNNYYKGSNITEGKTPSINTRLTNRTVKRIR
jgi:hypothetical protein